MIFHTLALFRLLWKVLKRFVYSCFAETSCISCKRPAKNPIECRKVPVLLFMYSYVRCCNQFQITIVGILLGEPKKNGLHKIFTLLKIVIFVNKTLKIVRFLCQSSSHYVIKSPTKNDPNLQKKCRRLHKSFRSHF